MIILVMSVLQSCNRNSSCECEIYASAPDELLSYAFFNDYEQWVYVLESDSNITDTLTNIGSVVELNGCDWSDQDHSNAASCTKVYDLALAHSNDSIFKPAGYSTAIEFVEVSKHNNFYSVSIQRSVNTPVDPFKKNIFIYPQIDPENQLPNSEYNAELLDSVQVNGTLYYNVILSKSRLGQAFDSVYWAPSIGIIKYNSDNLNTWIIKSYR